MYSFFSALLGCFYNHISHCIPLSLCAFQEAAPEPHGEEENVYAAEEAVFDAPTDAETAAETESAETGASEALAAEEFSQPFMVSANSRPATPFSSPTTTHQCPTGERGRACADGGLDHSRPQSSGRAGPDPQGGGGGLRQAQEEEGSVLLVIRSGLSS